MNILHFSLGLYPYRQGGLVRYSTDMAIGQSKKNKVFYLMPGKLGILDKKVRIKKGTSIFGLNVFRIENALPIPVFAGIKDIDLYTRPVDSRIYVNFLQRYNINIIESYK